jgi:DNA-binding XRE family transcriptional regulator
MKTRNKRTVARSFLENLIQPKELFSPNGLKMVRVETKEDTYMIAIAEIRKSQGLTQAELAQKANVSQRIISHYEKGDRVDGLLRAYRICKALDVSIDELVRLIPRKANE